jgi:putative ABC transport system permease protein
VLLVGAALLATSFTRLWNVERGFSTEGLIAMVVSPNTVDYPSDEDRQRFERELQERLSAIPGTRVSRTNQIPLSGSTSSTTYYIDQEDGEQLEATVMISVIGDDYLDVMEIALLEGRAFDGTEQRDGAPVAVANRALIERYWPGESGIGKELRADEDDPPTTIVGVAADVRGQSLAEDAEPRLYVPVRQNHRWGNQWVIRAQADPAAVIELARAAVSQVSPSTPVRDIEILEERIARSVAVPRFRTFFVVGLAVLATVLALLGVYGVVTFAVSQRTRELAVRMAIGAHPRDVIRGTLGRGVRMAVGGVVVGLLIAWQGGRLLEEFLFEVEPLDPLVYALVAVLVGAVSVLASYVPARRASRVDPVSVLNAE